MKQLFYWIGLCLAFLGNWSSSSAQSYVKLWEDVKSFQDKDLPKSQLEILQKIYQKAEKENNLPQMIKSFMVQGDVQTRMTPDSLSAFDLRLTQWVSHETNPVAKAILYSLLATYEADGKEADLTSVWDKFARSLRDRSLLAATPAKEFVPVVECGAISEDFFDDNLYDVLVRQAIRKLMDCFWGEAEAACEIKCDSLYGDLAALYLEKGMRQAELLTRVARAQYRHERMKHGEHCALKADSFVVELRNLLQQFGDLSVGGYVYLKLADYYYQTGDLLAAVQVAEEGIKRYPREKSSPQLALLIKHIQSPSMRMNTSFVYPENEVKLAVRYANLEEVGLKLYRLNASVEELRKVDDWTDADWKKRLGECVLAMDYALDGTPDFRERDTILTFLAPKAGRYALQSVMKEKKGESDYTLLPVSPYVCMVMPVSEKKWELRALDAKSGQPVAGAVVKTYLALDGELVFLQEQRADAHGNVILDKPLRGQLYAGVSLPGEEINVLSPSLWASVGGRFSEEHHLQKRVNLYTDRAVYRPGQEVQVSGLMYIQHQDSMRVCEGQRQTLRLYYRGKNLQEMNVKSDDFGVFSGKFLLPNSLLPGIYSIRGEEAAVSFRVEEYKRPTFYVEFTPYEDVYKLGDSLSVEAIARMFSGAPVRQAKVDFKVFRQKWYGFRRMEREELLTSGEKNTDGDGIVRFPVRLAPSETRDREQRGVYYRYRIEARVTDGAGESQSGELMLRAGQSSLVIQVGGLASHVVRKESADSIQFQVFNLNHRPVSAMVDYVVYRIEDEGKKKVNCAQGREKAFQNFLPAWLTEQASGRYMIAYEVRGEMRQVTRSSEEYLLFGADDHQPPVDTVAWFWQEGNTFGGEQPIQVFVGTGEKKVCLFVDVYQGNTRMESRQIQLDAEMCRFSYPYRKEYGEGIRVYYTLVKAGRPYAYQAEMVCAKPDKELQLTWKAFRNRLQPGAEEEWELEVRTPTGKLAQANLMATLYDASLDGLVKHDWNLNLYFPRRIPFVTTFNTPLQPRVSAIVHFPVVIWNRGLDWLYGPYSKLMSVNWYNPKSWVYNGPTRMVGSMSVKQNMTPASSAVDREESVRMADEAKDENLNTQLVDTAGRLGGGDRIDLGQFRNNFAETGFFYPRLRTDSTGRVQLKFTVPDALTEWHFMGLAHTRNMDYGSMDARVVTSKPFMIQPNLPRFLRQGDSTVVAASLVNWSAEDVKGVATMVWQDPVTGQVIGRQEQAFLVRQGGTGVVCFPCRIPNDMQVLVCRMTAQTGEFSDGEQRYLPILSSKQWVTESLSVQLEGKTDTVVRLPLHWKKEDGGKEQRLTVELTARPEGYVLQALPVLAIPQDEDALSWAAAGYAYGVARGLLESYPQIWQWIEAWHYSDGKSAGEEGKLLQNQELKSLLLQETPWVAEGLTEEEGQRRLLELLDVNRGAEQLQTIVARLQELQLNDGSWSWYKGMSGSRYITTQIVEWMARLNGKGWKLDEGMEKMYRKALKYLDGEVHKEYAHLKEKEKSCLGKRTLSTETVRYLYICSLDSQAEGWADRTVLNDLTTCMEKCMADLSIYEKALAAQIMQGMKRSEKAQVLVQSIREYLQETPESGAYFDTPKAEYSWTNYRIPTQVMAMEAIARIANDSVLIGKMQKWLLMQKRVQAWRNPVETVQAIGAFLMGKNKEKVYPTSVKAVVGKVSLQTPSSALGYLKQSWSGQEIVPDSCNFVYQGDGTGWATIYLQHLEEIGKIAVGEGKGVHIRKEYLKGNKVLSDSVDWQVGDKVTVRLTVRADWDMDFVQVVDGRAACMEPVSVCSGYRYVNGLGYYQVHRDASSCFYIDRMKKGTYVIEYDVYADRAGRYQKGVATVQSAYAPEYVAHSDGGVIEVTKN